MAPNLNHTLIFYLNQEESLWRGGQARHSPVHGS